MATPKPLARFLARGLVYQGVRDFATLRLGPEALVGLEPALAETLAPPLLPSEQYDALPLPSLCRELARRARTNEADYVAANARWQAERDLGALHRLFLDLASPETIALRLPAAASRYFNFGGGPAELVAPKTVRILNEGVPLALADWYAAACTGFSALVLGRSGATGVSLTREPIGASDGETVSLPLVVRWQ